MKVSESENKKLNGFLRLAVRSFSFMHINAFFFLSFERCCCVLRENCSFRLSCLCRFQLNRDFVFVVLPQHFARSPALHAHDAALVRARPCCTHTTRLLFALARAARTRRGSCSRSPRLLSLPAHDTNTTRSLCAQPDAFSALVDAHSRRARSVGAECEHIAWWLRSCAKQNTDSDCECEQCFVM